MISRIQACGVVVALLAAASMTGCGCSVPSGPTGPVVRGSGTLAPNEVRFVDADIPPETTQVDVRISWIAGLAVWQVDSTCTMEGVDACPVLGGSKQPQSAPLASSILMGSIRNVPRVRIVVKNTLADKPVDFSVEIEPFASRCGT
jgi:hypothetical protein